MNKKTLTDISIAKIGILMLNEHIAEKVKSAGKEGRSYKTFRVNGNGIISLGETNYWFWNQLIGCKFDLTFESWALAVWAALVGLSKGNNAIAIEEGLSVEIAKKTKRESEYNWVVDRLYEVFEHFCNNKDDGASLEGDRGKSGPSVIVREQSEQTPTVINVNLTGKPKQTFRFPDATGKAFLNLEMGVVGVSVEK